MSIDFLLYTHSSCGDVLSVFLGQLKQHAHGLNNFRLIVLSNDKEFTRQILEENEFVNFFVIEYSDDRDYSTHFEELRNVIGKYFLYMQEDFFLTSSWDLKNLNFYLRIMQKRNLSLLRLTPSGTYRSKAYVETFLRKSKICSPEGEFLRIDYLSSLPACMQPTIWRSSDFLNMHVKVKIRNLREEWSPSYRAYFKQNRMIGLATRRVEIPYIEVTAVRKGKWNFTDFKWGMILQSILVDYGVNPLDRGIVTYKHTVEEQQSNFIKDLWRRFRYNSEK